MMISAGATKSGFLPFRVSPIEGGQIHFYFQMSATGTRYYRVVVPYELVTVRERKQDGSVEVSDRYWIKIDDQWLEEDVKEQRDAVHRAWEENPYHIVRVSPVPKEEPDEEQSG